MRSCILALRLLGTAASSGSRKSISSDSFAFGRLSFSLLGTDSGACCEGLALCLAKKRSLALAASSLLLPDIRGLGLISLILSLSTFSRKALIFASLLFNFFIISAWKSSEGQPRDLGLACTREV